MLLTITTTATPATDLGYLLHKNPSRVHRVELSFGNATVFYPRAFPERANGRAEFEKTFKTVFEQIRSGKTAAPYMNIQPRQMKVQVFGNVAIATFHLDDRAGFVNRRTIVLNKSESGWKIVHLHASEVSVSSAQRKR